MASSTRSTAQPDERSMHHMWWCRFVPFNRTIVSTHSSVYGDYVKGRCLVCRTATELVPPKGH